MEKQYADEKHYFEQAQAISTLADAIADDRLIPGTRHAAVQKLVDMVDTLSHWTADDRN